MVIHDALYVPSILAMVFAKLARKRTVLIQHIGTIPFANPIPKLILGIANFLVTRPMMRCADRLAFIMAGSGEAVTYGELDARSNRLAHLLRQVDMVRLDHFRGFEAHWEIPATEPTAISGIASGLNSSS